MTVDNKNKGKMQNSSNPNNNQNIMSVTEGMTKQEKDAFVDQA